MASALATGSVSVFADQAEKKPEQKKREFEVRTSHADMFKEFLDSMLKEGKITQEEYDAQIAKIESVKPAPSFGFGRGNGFGRNGHNGFGKNRSFEKKEMTEEEKAQMKEKAIANAKERLAKQLEEGKITQEKYDEQLKKIESGEFAPGFGRGGNFNKGEAPDKNRSFEKKEMTEEEKAQMKEKAIANAKERLAKQLEEGKITQAEYDEQLKKIESGEFAPGFGRGNAFGRNRNFGRNNANGRWHNKDNKQNSEAVSE